MLDRIDVQIEMPAVPPEDLQRAWQGESSAAVRERVVAARNRPIVRQGKANADLAEREVDRHCTPYESGATLLAQAISRLMLSGRGYHRILKVARTIADLAAKEGVASTHVAEAIQYRRSDR